MALDVAHHRAFLACERNLVLTVFDLDTHAAIAHLPLRRARTSSSSILGSGESTWRAGSGAISVLKRTTPSTSASSRTSRGAKVHSLAVDVRTHRVYAPEEQEGGRPTARMVVFDASDTFARGAGSRRAWWAASLAVLLPMAVRAGQGTTSTLKPPDRPGRSGQHRGRPADVQT